MPNQTFKLPIDERHIQFGVMAYLAILAYPDSKEERNRFIEAYKALVIKRAMRHGYKRNLYRPALRAITNQAIDGTLRRGEARILHRFRAATLAQLRVFSCLGMPLIECALASLTGRTTTAHLRANDVDLGRRPSMNNLADWLAGEINLSRGVRFGGATGNHVKSRIWGESKPVVHLAWAMASRWEECGLRPGRTEFWDLFLQPNWLRNAMTQAELLRRSLCQSPELRFLGVHEDETNQCQPEIVEKWSQADGTTMV